MNRITSPPKKARLDLRLSRFSSSSILGILAAVVVPQYVSATDDAKKQATLDQLVKLREAMGVYYARSNAKFPAITRAAARRAS